MEWNRYELNLESTIEFPSNFSIRIGCIHLKSDKWMNYMKNETIFWFVQITKTFHREIETHAKFSNRILVYDHTISEA